MIKALVVDDERMVREGLKALTDWKQYNIEFVGEAKDGFHALQQLASLTIDMMFVDITMPNMNGFELMKRVQEQHPQVKVVILTCHHEFDYVQEALQLGAIDYIVKTLLNRENVDETMRRIMKRLERDSELQIDRRYKFAGGCYLFYETEYRHSNWQSNKLISENITELTRQWHRLDYKKLTTLEDELANEKCFIVEINSCKLLSDDKIEAWLISNGERLIYYSGNGTKRLRFSEELLTLWMHKLEPNSKENLRLFMEETEQYRWLVFPQSWNEWSEKVHKWYAPPQYIRQICHYFSQPLLLMLNHHTSLAFSISKLNATSWLQTEEWLQQLSILIRSRMGDLSLSHEVMLCMIKVIPLMHKQLAEDLTQNDLAFQVGMSRSYFSQCFKKFYGVSFSEVLKQLRMEEAKKKLVTTQLSIVEIANMVGFVDHKYFSRTFRMDVGQYPTEYRSLYYE